MKISNNWRLKFIVVLAFATPGIPEYLSGSWRLTQLFSTPLNFLFFLLMNIGLYTTGALLIREFAIVFRKGWFSIFIMGCAYGIMEEAIALHTFFQITGSPVGFLGTYGRFAGVDWVWASGLMIYHAVFSITLPLLLISIAYPELSGKRVTGKASASILVIIYGFTVFILNFVVNHTSSRPVPTYADYFLFLSLSLILVFIAYILPKNILHFRGREGAGLLPLFVLGFLFYPVYNIFTFIPVNPEIVTGISPILDILVHLVLFAAIGMAIIHTMPEKRNSRHKFTLSLGLVTSMMVGSFRLELTKTAPLIVFVDMIAIIFLIALWLLVKQNENQTMLGEMQLS